MTLRVSSYVIVAHLKDNKNSIVAHGVAGTLDRVPQPISKLILAFRGKAVPAGVFDDGTTALLLRRGYLTEASQDEERSRLIEIASQLRARGLAGKIPSFAFVPTYQCNLRCFYCFQPHRAHAGQGPYSAILSREQIAQAFAIIDQFSRPGALADEVGLLLGRLDLHGKVGPQSKLSEIGLFGGEPLTRATRVAIEAIAEHAAERGAALWAITNGTELEYYNDLLGTGPGKLNELQITIDGSEEHHNKRRKGPGLLATFATILENVERSIQRGVNVNIRMNTDQSNVGDIELLAALFGERGWTESPNFNFHCAVVTSPHKAPEPSWSELVNLTSQAQDRGLKVQSYEQSAQSFLLSCLTAKAGAIPHRKTANCAAEEGQLMFDCLGDVHGCWEDVGFRERRIGTYDAEGLHLDTEVVRAWFGRHPGMLEECNTCPYALIHASGCGAQAREATGTIMKNECAGFQNYFPASLSRAYEALEDSMRNDNHVETSYA